MFRCSRRELVGAGVGLAVAVGLWSEPADAARKRRVVWKSVDLPESKESKRRARTLRSVLEKESRQAEWGKHKDPIEGTVRVVEFVVVQRDDVVRVTCTAVGRIAGSSPVRTHFSVGDHPKRQRQLETTVLTFVARGIVTRLAAIARQRSSKA